jgi:hypothetical protein
MVDVIDWSRAALRNEELAMLHKTSEIIGDPPSKRIIHPGRAFVSYTAVRCAPTSSEPLSYHMV